MAPQLIKNPQETSSNSEPVRSTGCGDVLAGLPPRSLRAEHVTAAIGIRIAADGKQVVIGGQAVMRSHQLLVRWALESRENDIPCLC